MNRRRKLLDWLKSMADIMGRYVWNSATRTKGIRSGNGTSSTEKGIWRLTGGRKVRFVTLASLAMRLKDAARDGHLQHTLEGFRRQDLLIIDEWGYCMLDKKCAGYVYQVIADSYERKSLILTTNLPFSE